jgi:hypothetical protein
MYLSYQNQSIQFCKPDCLILDTGYVQPLSSDSNKVFQTCLVFFRLVQPPIKILSFHQDLHFCLSLPSILIYVIMWTFCCA